MEVESGPEAISDRDDPPYINDECSSSEESESSAARDDEYDHNTAQDDKSDHNTTRDDESDHNTAEEKYKFRLKVRSNVTYTESDTEMTPARKRKKTQKTPEQKDRNRELSRERMRKYRRKQKTDTPMTRAKIEQQRYLWKIQKQNQRRNMSEAKRYQTLQRRRELYKEKKNRKESFTAQVDSLLGNATPTKIKDLKKRHIVILPSTPTRFADTVQEILNQASPRKQDALVKAGLIPYHMTSNLKNNVKRLNKRKAKDQKTAKVVVSALGPIVHAGSTSVAKALGQSMSMDWRTLEKYSQCNPSEPRKRRNDAMTEDQEKEIEKVYTAEAANLPGKKDVKKGISMYALKTTTKRLYAKYLASSVRPVSLSTFRKKRPQNVLTIDKHKFRSSLCEKCLNVELKIQALKKIQKHLGKPAVLDDKFEAIRHSMCEPHTAKCIARQCSECGVKTVRKLFSDLLDYQEEVHWESWKTKHFVSGNKDQGRKRKGISKKVQVQMKGTITDLVDGLCVELGPLSKHIFTAQWQKQQFEDVRANLPQNSVLSVQDYAENFRTIYQDEIQSAHFCYNQITVFNMVSFFRCPKCDQQVHEASVFLSDDLVHDAHAVKNFEDLYISHLKNQNVKVDNHLVFSDGCATQFKSKIPFKYVEMSKADRGYTMERNFFASHHGKNECDSLGGLVKKNATTHIAARNEIITNASDMYKVVTSNLAKPLECSSTGHNSRVFFLVGEAERSLQTSNIKAVPGTLKIHNVRASSSGGVESRILSCYCSYCVKGDSEACPNKLYTEGWKNHSLQKTAKKVKAVSSRETRDVQSKEIDMNGVYHGPMPLPEVRSMMADLIHQPFAMQQTTAKTIRLGPIVPRPDLSIFSLVGSVDQQAYTLLHDVDEVKDKNLFPLLTKADGNCLPRCGSFLAYGSEEHHADIRLRIALELMVHKDLYMDHEFLRRGLPPHQAGPTSVTYAQYSDYYMYGEVLTPNKASEIYNREVNEILQEDSYSGIWQVFGLASVLGCPIVSVYPRQGNPSVRTDLNRRILPRAQTSSKEAYIMWTSLRTDQTSEHWVPNHFVPLLPIGPGDSNEEYRDDPVAVSPCMHSSLDLTSSVTDAEVAEVVKEITDFLNDQNSVESSDESFGMPAAVTDVCTHRYRVGTYLLVSCGAKTRLPVVVVSSPPNEEEPCSWIQYFHAKDNKRWILEDKIYKLDEDDIITEICKPTELQIGRHRVEYDFGVIN